MKILDTSTAQNLTNLAWSFGQLSFAGMPVLGAIGHRFLKLEEIQPQNLAGMAWASSTLGHFHESSFSAIPRWAAGVLNEAHAQELANLAQAPGNLLILSNMLMTLTCQESQKRAWEPIPQEPSNLAWCFGKLFVEDQPMSGRISEASLQKASQLGPQNPTNIAQAFATSAVLGLPLMKMASDKGSSMLDQLVPQDASNLSWAFGTLDLSDEALASRLPQACLNALGEPTTQNLGHCSGKCSVLIMKSLLLKRYRSRPNRLPRNVANTL